MSDIAIRAEGLSKRYRIGQRERYRSLRETLTEAVKAPLLRLRGRAIDANQEFWALNDVSFEVKHGEVIGVIGRNGAGKSTLLKILTRITEPTRGWADLNGRVASLLEVGTGFHPELTGRENIYLNGAILGMKRVEIDRKFDEIVSFAEIDQFLDTPVKRYSSGMYVRLAFAVAAHLEPEILLVDEVLAVGDAAFQKKCLGKMGEVAQGGRTILFVSHNMAAVQKLCTQGVFLEKGQVAARGNIQPIIEQYISSRQSADVNGQSLGVLPRPVKGYGEKVRFIRAEVVGKDGIPRQGNIVMFGESFSILLEAEASQQVDEISAIVGFETILESRIATLASESAGIFFKAEPGQPLQVQVHVDDLLLRPGHYLLSFAMRRNGKPLDQLPYVMQFEVAQESARQNLFETDLFGVVHASGHWSLLETDF